MRGRLICNKVGYQQAARDIGGDVLRLYIEIWWPGRFGGQASIGRGAAMTVRYAEQKLSAPGGQALSVGQNAFVPNVTQRPSCPWHCRLDNPQGRDRGCPLWWI